MTRSKKPISSTMSFKDKAFNGLGSLLKLLPTGTVFLFQFLNPVLSNNGHCHAVNKYLTRALLVTCSLNCVVATFTDSYTDEEGNIHYRFATFKGLWPSLTPSSEYRVKAVVAVLDPNTVGCYAPGWETTRKTMLMVLPTVVGAVCSAVFAVFPSTRHGIGYPSDAA